jgi:hypothetical protein
MPTYLVHGFRWPRNFIRIHVVLNNLDDAASEWVVAPKTTLALLKNFSDLYPESMEHLGKLRFVEQYDPSDSSQDAVSQPFAYVADLVEEVKLGVEIDEIRGRGLDNEQWNAIMELRDKLAPEEKVGWFVVVCGDEERAPPPESSSEGSGVSGALTPNRLSDPPPGAAAGPEVSVGTCCGDESQTLIMIRRSARQRQNLPSQKA